MVLARGEKKKGALNFNKLAMLILKGLSSYFPPEGWGRRRRRDLSKRLHCLSDSGGMFNL